MNNKNQLKNKIMKDAFNYLQDKTALNFDKIMLINNNIYLGDLSSFNIIRIEYKDGYLIELIKVWDDLDHFKVVNEDIKFIIENKGYYYFQRIANKPIPILRMDEDINEIFYLLPDKNGTYRKDTYSETTKRHYTLDGLLSENDTIIRYKNEIPAKKWDLPECE